MTTANLERAIANARSVLANVRADQLHDSTPCASWDVSGLINHLVGGANWFADNMTGGETAEADYAAGDYLAAYDTAAQRAVEAFSADGAMQQMVQLPFGTFPGVAFMGLATTDTFTHTWDLARATGQDAGALDPELAAQLLGQAKATIPDAFRGADGAAPFGPQAPVAEDAPAADQLAAFLGRNV